MNRTVPELSGRASEVLDAFGDTPIRFVGGCVRDALLGREPTDLDLATTALPEETLRILGEARIKAVPTGIEHGTVTAVVGGRPFEITTLRRDVETDGRRAIVAFTTDWREDASRRDFTINALSADRDGQVHDYFAGLADLALRRVRFVGDPVQRIREDYLRVLRFYRFSAWYADAFDEQGRAACAANLDGLARLSGERVRAELWKLLAAPRAAEAWRAMRADGVVAALVPQATDVAGLERVIATGQGDHVTRFAALLPMLDAPPLEAIGERLRLSRAERVRLNGARFDGLAARRALVAKDQFARALYGAPLLPLVDAVLVDSTIAPDRAAAFARFAKDWSAPRFPIHGGDLQQAGMEAGPQLGALLGELESWWVERDFAPSRDALLGELGRRLR
ncbi:MAG: tRNA nucleotidyltransferase [Rhodospirillales bacterium]|nr:tRNA nucleotidyltransferase [Rhodospirillales bacterium]